MPLDGMLIHEESGDGYTFWFYQVELRNILLIMVSDNPDGTPGLGNIALCAIARIPHARYTSGTIPMGNAKYDVLSRSVAEILSRKLESPVVLFLDVHFEPTDSKIVRKLKIAVNKFTEWQEDTKK